MQNLRYKSLAPLIGQLLSTALDRERAINNASTVSSEACGVLVLAPNGDLQMRTPAADRWLAVLQEVDRSREHHLPTVVWSAIAGLRAGGQLAIQASVRVPTSRGLLRVEASPVGDNGTVAVVLAPQVQPGSIAIPAHWELTPQERLVTEHVIRGLSNHQIAAALVITEHTVESHLKHVYEKMGVHSRSQLLAFYFAEAHNPDSF